MEASKCRLYGKGHCQWCRTHPEWRVEVGMPDVCPDDWKPGIGLGDAIAAIATPIARALKLSCIDPATKNLKPESKCAQRKARLNALTRKA